MPSLARADGPGTGPSGSPGRAGHPGAASSPFWTNVTTSVGPPVPPNSASLMTYDAADNEVVLLGGFYVGGIGYSYTWVFANDAWTNITGSAGSPPPPPADGTTVMTYDASGGYVLAESNLVGSGCSRAGGLCNLTWEFNAGEWTLSAAQNPPVGSDPVMAYDPATGYAVLLEQTTLPRVETWSYQAGQWTQLDPIGTANGSYVEPPVSPGAGLVYDAAEGYLLYFGGSGCGANGACNGTWSFSDGNWTQLHPATSPPGRDGAALVYDPTDGYVLLFGGRNESLGPEGVFDYNDTWTFQAGDWTELETATSPGPRSYAAATFDQSDGLALLFGGFQDTPRASLSMDTSWVWTETPPIVSATITALPPETDPGVPVAFSASLVGGYAPFNYSWQFGDGDSSTLPDPSHAYNAPGNYTVRLNVSDPGGQAASSSLRVGVSSGTALSIATSPNPTDVGVATHFSLSGGGGTPPYTYSWTFGDGSRGASATGDHTYNQSGTYTVDAWKNDSVGDSFFATTPVQVNPTLQILQLNAEPNPARLLQPVNFSSSVSGGSLPYTYAWAFGDGATGGNLSAIAHAYSTEGPFEVTLTVVDAAGAQVAASVNVSIVLNVTVTADASLGAPSLTVAFTSQVLGGVPAYTYVWGFGDGGTSSVADPVHTYDTAGNYTAALSVTDSLGHVATANWSVTVFPGGGDLTASLHATPDNLSVDQTTQVVLAPSGGQGKYTVTWTSVPAGCVETSLLLLTCTPTASGTFTATVQVSDSVGDLAEGSATFNVSGTRYLVTFAESGLPTGTEWYVNVTGEPSLSNLTTPSGGTMVTAQLTNGSYSVRVASSNTRWAASYGAGFNVSGGPTSVGIVFSRVTYPVAFFETGLPAGVLWSVTFDSVVNALVTNGGTDPLGFAPEPNGSYGYSIAPVPHWAQYILPAVGTVTVNGTALTVLLTYSVPLFAVTFNESGLPSGAGWSVTLNGSTLSSANASITFRAANGSLPYSVGSVGAWTPAGATGSLTVSGAPVSVSVEFVFSYLVSFGRPSGTPNGTTWSVSLSGPGVLSPVAAPGGTVTLSSTGPGIRFREPNGTYAYTFTLPDYPNYVATGNVTVSGASAFVFPPPLPSSTPGGGGPGGGASPLSVPDYLVFEVVTVLAVILVTGVFVGRRRRRPPTTTRPPAGSPPPAPR